MTAHWHPLHAGPSINVSFKSLSAMPLVQPLSPFCGWELKPCEVPQPVRGGARLSTRGTVDSGPGLCSKGLHFPVSAVQACGGRSELTDFSEILLPFYPAALIGPIVMTT